MPFDPFSDQESEKEKTESSEKKAEKTDEKKKEKSKTEMAGQDREIEISLMPGKAIVIPRIIRSRFLIFIATLVTVLTIAFVIWLYTNWHFEKIGAEVERIKGEIQLLTGKSSFYFETRDKIAGLEEKARKVESILNNHIYWTKFFKLLEAYTIPDIYYGDFSADTSGMIHLNATARNLLSAARQYIAFSEASDFVKEVKASGVKKIPNGISLSFDLVLVDGVFKK